MKNNESQLAKKIAISFLLMGIRPDELLSVSDWADKYRRLSSKASAEAGQWDTSRTPYLREIMDSLSVHNPLTDICFMKGAQVGGSEGGFNWIGYVISQTPGPMLMVQPTVDIAKRVSKQRIAPMIEECEVLRDKVKPMKSRDSGNTLMEKEYPGGILLFAGANSAAGLRSMPIRFLFMDEVDAYPQDVEGEGSPTELAKARTRTFANRKKIFEVSTPTISGKSSIERSFEESDQRFFNVPCPCCNKLQKLNFKNLIWETGKPETVQYACGECGELFKEHNKTWMLSKGAWIKENPESKKAGFHLSSLYSPVGWLSWASIVEMWEKAQSSQELLKAFVNTILGETWKEVTELPDWKKVYTRREIYGLNEVPEKALFITAAVDVQKDRLECEIKGWGRNKESWSIDYRKIYGDPAQTTVWQELNKILNETWVHPSGQELHVKMMAVDSGGHYTQECYAWGREQDPRRVMIVKGSSNNNPKAILETTSKVEISKGGKKIKTGLNLWLIGTSIAKSELYTWLKYDHPTEMEIIERGFPAGYCHFPKSEIYGEDFFKGLAGEQLVGKKNKRTGFTQYYWEKIFDRNEPLDLHVYNRAAATHLGIDRYSDQVWSKLESQLGVEKIKRVDQVKVEPIVKKKTKPPRKKRESSFWSK